jgi:hypothetical protein
LDPLFDIAGIEADEMADLVERDPTLEYEPPNESLGHCEACGDGSDVKERGRGLRTNSAQRLGHAYNGQVNGQIGKSCRRSAR